MNNGQQVDVLLRSAAEQEQRQRALSEALQNAMSYPHTVVQRLLVGVQVRIVEGKKILSISTIDGTREDIEMPPRMILEIMNGLKAPAPEPHIPDAKAA